MIYRKTGIVAHFNYDRGFGFITPTDKSTPDIFVHRNKCGEDKFLRKGTLVDFNCVETPRGYEVTEVFNIDETNAELSEFDKSLRDAGPESDWIYAKVKFFRRDRCYGFVHGGALRRDAFFVTEILFRCGMRGVQAGDPVSVKVRSQGNGNLLVSAIKYREG